MTRSPLAYPLNRGIDGDAGGAADLQTDIMRFMAILALCLVAIFALVQSIPLAPQAPKPDPIVETTPPVEAPPVVEHPEPVPIVETEPPPAAAEPITLTRPKWHPKPRPERVVATIPAPATPAPVAMPEPVSSPPVQEGFTLRFESDLALTRLVASSQVGFYAIAESRSQRMAVSNSRISFWDASTPNAFHEMEAATVPAPVIDALGRSGVDTSAVNWGVTLPGKLSRQLEALMLENSGGSLVIGADGQLRMEAQ